MLAGGMRVVTRVCLGLCAAVGLACFAFVGQNTPTVLETDSGLDLANLYHEDVVRGDKIIQQMSDKVVSPVWNALTGDPRMRKVLAAALGAEKGGAGQVSLANLFRTGPESSPEANAQGAASRSSQVDVMRRSLASLANRPLHAGNLHLQMQSYRKGLEVKALGQVMGKGRQQLRQAPSFVYNVYAPGVISGKTVQSESVGSPKAAEQKKHDAATSESMHRPIKGKEKTTASQTSVKTSNPLVDDLKKATGFEDEYHHSDSIVGALERKVQALSRTEEAQSAMLQASKRAFMKNAKALNKQVTSLCCIPMGMNNSLVDSHKLVFAI